jgi:hypothetical protein
MPPGCSIAPGAPQWNARGQDRPERMLLSYSGYPPLGRAGPRWGIGGNREHVWARGWPHARRRTWPRWRKPARRPSVWRPSVGLPRAQPPGTSPADIDERAPRAETSLLPSDGGIRVSVRPCVRVRGCTGAVNSAYGRAVGGISAGRAESARKFSRVAQNVADAGTKCAQVPQRIGPRRGNWGRVPQLRDARCPGHTPP